MEKGWRIWSWFDLIIVMAICLAICLGGCRPFSPTHRVPAPTAQPKPTNTPFPIESSRSSPHQVRSSDPTPGVFAQVEVRTTEWEHPQGFYKISVPEAWRVSVAENTVSFAEPSGGASLSIQLINTGYQLDGPSFERLVSAWRTNTQSNDQFHQEIPTRTDVRPGEADFENIVTRAGVSRIVATSFRQFGSTVIILSFSADPETFEAYRRTFAQIAGSVIPNVAALSSLEVYGTGNSITYANRFFSIELPAAWKFEHTSENSSAVHTYYSPDEAAVVQIIAYGDGKPMSRQIGGKFLLKLLQYSYAGDFKITQDEMIQNIWECLHWQSESGDFQGQSCYTVRGNNLLVLTTMIQEQYLEVYQELLGRLFSTLTS